MLKLDDQVIACACYICRVMQIHTKDEPFGVIALEEKLVSFKLYNQGKSCACEMQGSDTFKVVK